MYLYALFYDTELIGLFDNEEEINNMKKGLTIHFTVESDLKVKVFKKNTLIEVENTETEDKYEKSSEANTTLSYHSETEEEKVDSEEKEKIIEEKKDVQRQINKMKELKDKLEERRNIYDNDIKLYNLFKLKLEEEEDFKIPELFEKKFKLLRELEGEDKLNFENFNRLYVEERLTNSYMDIFSN